MCHLLLPSIYVSGTKSVSRCRARAPRDHLQHQWKTWLLLAVSLACRADRTGRPGQLHGRSKFTNKVQRGGKPSEPTRAL
ncbi:hypothetical protein AAFF_G00441030 [Aldrovandia affinis]|uniref:Uncharacterized protein n=1 Tax=Aldrovandia affinis TaxID=143900 RepID=A0AAD7S7C4_9TELE|nr:hypothetical protein AAFF_G00441030 [Aldrovandia affinis]